VLAFAGSAAAQTQQSLQRVKDLYSQASYEDALGVLSDLDGNEPVTEVARYRAACLLALGRSQDAKAAVAEIVLAHPEYVPDGSETSPRVMELFRATRRTTVPGVAKALYAEARAAMERQDSAGAVERFERVIRLVDDPDLADNTALSDMKLLATDFLELARLRSAKAAPAAAPPAAPAETPRPAAPVTAAVPINQQLPPWTPLDSLGKRWEFSGLVRLVIGADGHVVSARIERSVHPAYDAALLNAARRWTYHPALQDGKPVESERTVQVVLKPPR
jgi:protein TonB